MINTCCFYANAEFKYNLIAIIQYSSVIHNRVNVLEFLMTQIGDTMVENDVDKSQNTPLHRAAEKGFLKCCKVILRLYLLYKSQNAKRVPARKTQAIGLSLL